MSKAKIKKGSQQIMPETDQFNWQGIALIMLVGLLVFYPPYFQGLFFKQHMFVTHILTSAVFILVWVDKWKRRDLSLITGPLDWGILGYAVAYALSLITAVVIGEAVYGFFKALNYFIIYWMITQVVKDYTDTKKIIKILLISAIGVTIIGIFAATGIIDYPQAINNNHLISTMGYLNALAIYLAVMILLGTTLLMGEKNIWWQLFYCTANFLMMLATLASISKGAWIVLAFGIVLLILGLPRGYRLKAFYYLSLAVVPAIIISDSFMAAVFGGTPSTGNALILGGLMLVLGGWLLWRLIEPRLERIMLSRSIIIGLISLSLILFVFIFNQIGLSDRITGEIAGITDTQHSSYVTRVDFMRWGIAIIKDYPLTGAGAGGWEALYRQYQEYNFMTTETHSHIFQVGVEAGLIGVGAFVSIWIIFFFLLYKLYIFHRRREAREEWVLIWGIAVAALGLGIHSCFDFDLSLPAMAILLWTLLALLSVSYKHSREKQPNQVARPWLNIGISVLLAALLLLGGGQYYFAHQQAQIGQKILQSIEEQKTLSVQQLNQAGNSFSRAVKYDPLNAGYWSYLSSLQGYSYRLLYEMNHEQANITKQQSITAAYKALELDSYDVNINRQLMQNLAALGDLDGLIRAGELYIKTLPNDPQAYKKVAALWWDASRKCEENKQHDLALKFAGEIIVLDKALQDQLRKVDVDHPFWQGEKLTVTPEYEEIYRQTQDFVAAAENS